MEAPKASRVLVDRYEDQGPLLEMHLEGTVEFFISIVVMQLLKRSRYTER